MAVTRAQKVRLGIFLAVALTVGVGGLVLLAGMKLGEKRDRYTVRFSEAAVSFSGLDVGSPVKYSGIRIGNVEAIRIDPNDVSVIEVTLDLVGGTPVAEDSVASLGSLGITGLKYVELSRGSSKARVRKPGETIPAGSSLLDTLTDQATVIAAKVETLLGQANAFTTPEMKEKVAELLDRGSKLLATTEEVVSENRGNLQMLSQRVADSSAQVQALAATLQRTSARLEAMIATSGPQLQRLLEESVGLVAELRRSRAQLDGLLAESRGTLQDARAVVGKDGLGKTMEDVDRLVTRGYLVLLQSQEDLSEALGHLRETSENMNAFSQRIKEDPSLLLMGGSESGAER